MARGRKYRGNTFDPNLVIRTLSDPATWQKGKAVARNTLFRDGMTVGEYLAAPAEDFTEGQRYSHIDFSLSRGRIRLDDLTGADADSEDQAITESENAIDVPAPGEALLSLDEAAAKLCPDASNPIAALRKRISRGSIETAEIDGETKVRVAY